MQKGWLKRAGRYPVIHLPCPNPGQAVDLSAGPYGVQHTIEGSLESGLAVFRQHYAPHFTGGRDRRGTLRLYQHVPLGTMSAALVNAPGGVETNRDVRVQVEWAAFSKHEPWLPDAGEQDLLASLYQTLRHACGIPLRHPRVARNWTLWEHAAGWVGHIDVPENSHWDAGAFRYEDIFEQARAKAHKPPTGKPDWHIVSGGVDIRKTPRKTDRVRTLAVRRAARKAEPVSCHTHAKEGT